MCRDDVNGADFGMSPRMTHTRVHLLFTAAACLGGCAQPPQAPAALPAAPAATAPVDASASALTPPTVPQPEQVAAPAVATPQQRQQAQAMALAATLALETGNEESAKAELQRALTLDGANRLAQSLRRQISEDPVALLGRDAFAYTVRPNESMSSLAGRFLNDVYLFYALARYNGVAVPRQLVAGQILKIPGRAPPVSPPAAALPLPAPAVPSAPSPAEQALRAGEAAERAGDVDRALVEYRKAAQAYQPGAAARLERLVKQDVSRHTVAARTAFAKQDLDGAIRNWERVLQVDPTNETARLELQRSKALKEKVRNLPDKS
jgi:tetratricopeptide (TPR) repeat protein